MNLYPSSLARDAALGALPAASWINDHRTFAEFAEELDRLLPLSEGATALRTEARNIGRLAVLMQAAAQGGPDLQRLAESPRALHAAGALIASWKGASLRPADVRAAAADLEGRTETARIGGITKRIAALYDLYEKQLGKYWTDREASERDLLRRLAACERIPARLLKSGERVVLHGFHKLAYIQFRIVEKLIALKHDVLAHAPIFSESSPFKNAFVAFRKTFGSARIETDAHASFDRATIQRVEASSPYGEVYEMGRRVRRWITEENVPPSSIAVSFRDLGQYSQAVHDVFRRLEIPFYERRGEPAQFQPLVRVALSAVDACVEGLHRRGVFRFLCAGPVDVAALAGMDSTRIGADAMRALALEAGIDRMHGPALENPVAAWTAKLKRFLPAINARALCVILERLNALRSKRTAHAFAHAWRGFFNLCGLSAAKLSATKGEPGDATGEAKERLALNALDAALTSVADIPNGSTEKIALETFAELLNAAIQEQSVRAEGTDRAGVRVLNFYDMRGLRFKRLLLGGLSEGLCPARSGGDPLLGQGGERALREALAARVNDREAAAYLAPRLSDENEMEERALFQSTLSCAAEQILLFRPQRGFDGAALGASEYWDDYAGPVEKSLAIHPAPPLAECVTAEEWELRAAWILGGGAPAAAQDHARDERDAALAAFESAPRLKTLARFAAVERGRYQFFLEQSIASARHEKEPGAPAQCDSAGIYDGIVAVLSPGGNSSGTFSEIAAGVAQRLAPKGIGDPALGPSDIERLAACPFRFFLERVCGFDALEEPGNEASPLDMGSLWHTVLNSFYKEELDRAATEWRLTARLNPRRRETYLNRLLFFAGAELFKTSSEKFTGHPGFWKLQDERLRALLGKWLDCELAEPADGFFPAMVEFSFGPDAAGKGGLTVPLNSAAAPAILRIKGRMDRLDFKTEERNGTETIVAVRVIDYKLGRGARYADKTKPARMSQLRAAQLPVYMAAAVNHLFNLRDEKKAAVDFERVWNESRAGYYSLRDTPLSSRNPSKKFTLVKEWPLGDLRTFLDASSPEGLFDLTRRHVAAILQGAFPVHPADCDGLYCPARYACRYQAIPAMQEEE